MIPAEARDILFYYGSAVVFFCLVFMFTGRKRKGMRLRLKGAVRMRVDEPRERENVINITGHASQPPGRLSHIQPPGERPLNVVFNYNGHSWDAYEILGLPAGSSPEKVEQAYREALKTIDAGSKPFMEAAYHAIQAEWKTYRATGTGSR